MSRPLRLEHPGAFWHVTNRGVERRDIYRSDADRETFIDVLAGAVDRFRWRLHAYVLMGNHFHLLVETVDPTLSRGMHTLGSTYARLFNQRHERSGHLFQARFDARLIDSERYLMTVARYVVLNPVRAGMVRHPADWRWSSYRATAGIERGQEWLTTHAILSMSHPTDTLAAALNFRDLCAEGGHRSPWDDLVGQLYLGDKDFIARVQRRIDERERSIEHPREQTSLCRTTIADLQHALIEVLDTAPRTGPHPPRLAFALLARAEALASLPAIGAALGVGSTGAGYLVKRAKLLSSTDPTFRELLTRVRQAMKNCALQT